MCCFGFTKPSKLAYYKVSLDLNLYNSDINYQARHFQKLLRFTYVSYLWLDLVWCLEKRILVAGGERLIGINHASIEMYATS